MGCDHYQLKDDNDIKYHYHLFLKMTNITKHKLYLNNRILVPQNHWRGVEAKGFQCAAGKVSWLEVSMFLVFSSYRFEFDRVQEILQRREGYVLKDR